MYLLNIITFKIDVAETTNEIYKRKNYMTSIQLKELQSNEVPLTWQVASTDATCHVSGT